MRLEFKERIVKTMTDNFNRFREFMQLPEQEGGDAYYVIELVRRGKDCPDQNRNAFHRSTIQRGAVQPFVSSGIYHRENPRSKEEPIDIII